MRNSKSDSNGENHMTRFCKSSIKILQKNALNRAFFFCILYNFMVKYIYIKNSIYRYSTYNKSRFYNRVQYI